MRGRVGILGPLHPQLIREDRLELWGLRQVDRCDHLAVDGHGRLRGELKGECNRKRPALTSNMDRPRAGLLNRMRSFLLGIVRRVVRIRAAGPRGHPSS